MQAGNPRNHHHRKHSDTYRYIQLLPKKGLSPSFYFFSCLRPGSMFFFVLDVFSGDRKAWIIVAYEPLQKKLLGIWLTPEKKDHDELVKRFGRHPVYTDGALYYESACKIIGIEHHVYTFGSWLQYVLESVICTQIKDMTTSSHAERRVTKMIRKLVRTIKIE